MEDKMINNYSNITLSLSKDMVKQLKEYAKELNLKQSHIVSIALQNYFDNLDLKIAQKREDEPSISAEEVWKSLGV